jgi:hypothetical protein
MTAWDDTLNECLAFFWPFFLYCKIPFSVGEVGYILVSLFYILMKSVLMSEFGVEKINLLYPLARNRNKSKYLFSLRKFPFHEPCQVSRSIT